MLSATNVRIKYIKNKATPKYGSEAWVMKICDPEKLEAAQIL
jgi:hypothetical protein